MQRFPFREESKDAIILDQNQSDALLKRHIRAAGLLEKPKEADAGRTDSPLTQQ